MQELKGISGGHILEELDDNINDFEINSLVQRVTLQETVQAAIFPMIVFIQAGLIQDGTENTESRQ